MLVGSSFNLQIRWPELTLTRLIGHGGYGDVHTATYNGKTVAVKVLHAKILAPDAAAEFRKELQLMSTLKHPNLVVGIGACQDVGHYSLVMQYMPKGSLYTVLHDPNEALPWVPIRWQIALEMTQGLAYLHAQSIFHRDFKSGNVLLDSDYHVRLADYGFSKVKTESSSSNPNKGRGVGTIRWRAPETFRRGYKWVTKGDVYGLGMVFWELDARQLPFSDEADEQVVMGWIKDGEKENISADTPSELKELIQLCWKSADQRPEASDLVTAIRRLNKIPVASTSTTVKSWHVAPGSIPAVPTTQEYVLLDAAAQDKQKVATFYQYHPMAGYDLKSVRIIYNPNMNRMFVGELRLLQARHQNPAFEPKWFQVGEPADKKAQRRTHNDLLTRITTPHTDSDFPNVKLLPLWHGTRPELLDSVFKTGFANLATTDTGFFGKGSYSTYDAEYAYRVYSKGALLLNWMCWYSAYPVIDGDMPELMGKGNFANYDAHFVPVASASNSPTESVYLPCRVGQAHQYIEVVVFNARQCLPRYLVELQPSLPAPMPVSTAQAHPAALAASAANPKPLPSHTSATALAAAAPGMLPTTSTSSSTSNVLSALGNLSVAPSSPKPASYPSQTLNPLSANSPMPPSYHSQSTTSSSWSPFQPLKPVPSSSAYPAYPTPQASYPNAPSSSLSAYPAPQTYPTHSNVPQSHLWSAPALISIQQVLANPTDTQRQQVTQLLTHVVKGHQNQVEELLKKDPLLALIKGNIADMDRISGFQCAIWMLDWHMWMMMLKYLKADPAIQAEALKDYDAMMNDAAPLPWQCQHDKVFSLQPIIQAYEQCLKACQGPIDTSSMGRIQRSDLSSELRQLPIHVIQEANRTDYKMDGNRSFTEPDFPRESIGYDSYSDPIDEILNTGFVCVPLSCELVKNPYKSIAMPQMVRFTHPLTSPILDALKVLEQCRFSQVQALREALIPAVELSQVTRPGTPSACYF